MSGELTWEAFFERWGDGVECEHGFNLDDGCPNAGCDEQREYDALVAMPDTRTEGET